MGRSIFIIFVILAILVSITPQAQANIAAAWESVRPAVVQMMDNLYTAVRGFVAGSDSHHHINEHPVIPDANFDVIITMRSALPS